MGIRVEIVLSALGLVGAVAAASCSTFGGDKQDASDAGLEEAGAVDAGAEVEGGGSPGPVVEIATGEKAPGPVAADATGVYWVDKEGAVRRSDKAKSSPVTLAVGPPDAVDLRLDATTLYVYSPAGPVTGSTIPCNILFRVDTDGTKAQKIGLGACTGLMRMTVDATHVILAGVASPAQIMLIPRQAGTPTFTPDGTSKLGAIASDGSKLYWAREIAPAIAVGPKGGDGSQNKLLAQSPSKPMDVTVDLDPAGSVFWLTEGGEVMAQDKLSPGGTPRTLASAQPAPVRLAVDATHVYWTNGSNGTVMRARKDGSAQPDVVASGLGSPYGLALAEGGVYVTTREGRVVFISLGP